MITLMTKPRRIVYNQVCSEQLTINITVAVINWQHVNFHDVNSLCVLIQSMGFTRLCKQSHSLRWHVSDYTGTQNHMLTAQCIAHVRSVMSSLHFQYCFYELILIRPDSQEKPMGTAITGLLTDIYSIAYIMLYPIINTCKVYAEGKLRWKYNLAHHHTVQLL